MQKLIALLQNARLWQLGLAAYWITLFVATHIPVERLPGNVNAVDKFVHLAAFAILAFLFATTWQLSAGRLMFRHILWAWVAVTLYGAFEEATQPFVNRVASLLDWTADAAGAALGLLLFVGVRHVLERVVPKRTN